VDIPRGLEQSLTVIDMKPAINPHNEAKNHTVLRNQKHGPMTGINGILSIPTQKVACIRDVLNECITLTG